MRQTVRTIAATVVLVLLFAQAAFAEGKHVILLIDDSADMKGWRQPLETKLPGWLFRGPDPSDPNTPRFDPATDTLSVLYFALHNEGRPDACKTVRGDVVSPDTLLELEHIGANNEETFRRALRESLDKPCRFGGHLSPIMTSPVFALPYVQDRLPQGALFSRVLIAIASNEQYNFNASTPAAELSYLVTNVPDYDVQVPEATHDLAASVTRAFNFDTNVRWKDDRIGLRYRVIEAVARGRGPEASIVFNRRLQLDRVATSDDRVLGVPKVPGAGDIRIPRGDLVPLRLEWVSSTPNSKRGSVDLLQCPAPVCTKGDDGVRIDLFDNVINPFVQNDSEPPLRSRTLAFRVAFRRTTGKIYDHQALESEWQQMELAPVPVARGWFLMLPLRFGNSLLTRLWLPWDGVPPEGGLTQDEGVARLARMNFVAWTSTILLLLFVIARVARRSRVYTFEPSVEWSAVDEVVLDFDRPGHSRVLIGSLIVRNRGSVGWLGRRLGDVEQPTRNADVSLDGDVAALLSSVGIQRGANALLSIGFVDGGVLKDSVRESVSHGRQVQVFLAEETIADFVDGGDIEEKPVSLSIPVKLVFAPNDVADPQFATVRESIEIKFRVKPESARMPKVTFERASNRELHYGHDARLPIGRFHFESAAKCSFARPWQQPYALTTTCEKRPLAGTPTHIVPSAIHVDAHGHAQASVELWCADAEVRNPEPAVHHYTFALQGNHEADYRANDLAFELRRDPARSELELQLTYRNEPVDVHWNAAKKTWAYSAEGGVGVGIAGNVVRFEQPSRYAFEPDEATFVPLSIVIGNSAKSGRGSVSVCLEGKLVVAPDVAGALRMRSGWEASDIVRVQREPLVVREGDAPIEVGVDLKSTPIASIDGGELPAEKCSVQITFTVEIKSDAGEVEKRSLVVQFPLHLEQLPGANVVVIDFGTSSIAAAVGTAGKHNADPLLDLQHVKVYQNESIAVLDPEGAESGTRFLPSAIVCDADERRQIDEYGQRVPPGFPRYTGPTGASLVPSAASFVSLPARKRDFEERSHRVLLSLKTWLGLNAQRVPLPSGEVRYQEGANIRIDGSLPLDELLQASYSALAQAYLKSFGPLGAGQVVICHPNTFSEMHRERLRGVAWNALAGPLGIIAEKHLHLMSESDAVAYAYCWDRMRQAPPPRGIERVLVYDLGAGTLDLSVISIEWNADPIYPKFLSRHHLGVPIAGNYFDQTLARIIHELLSDKEVLGTEKLQYVHPVVANAAASDDHAKTTRALWNAIRQAKQRWGERDDFEVVVGRGARGGGVVVQNNGNPGPPVPMRVHGGAGVVIRNTDDGEQLVLVIPREQITAHPRIERLVEFATREVVREALSLAGVRAEDVNTLIVSGRGALWPGLRQRVEAEVPKARAPHFTANEMKAVVARGAIARHDLVHQHAIAANDGLRGRLAVVYGHDAGRQAVFEEEWDRPIRIPVAHFRIVDVSLKNPDPARDLGNGSLRKHFYVNVGRREYATRQVGGSNVLRFRRVRGGGVVITNDSGGTYRIDGDHTVPQAIANWPVGHPFLDPNEEES